MSDAHYRQVLEEYALSSDSLDQSRLRQIKDEMERTEQQRLAPHHIASFFLEAFRTLSGTIGERERGRYEIRNVPAEIRRRDRQIGRGIPLLQRYDRIDFDKALVKQKDRPDAEFVPPGHPLLDALIDLVIERFGELLRRGAVLVEPQEGAEETRALFYVQNDIVDGTTTPSGEKRVIGRRVHFVEIAEDGGVSGGAVAPYLVYRALSEEELPLLDTLLQISLVRQDHEGEAKGYSVAQLVPQHLAEVKARREVLLNKTVAAVKDRLTKEINYWDMRAEELKAQELAGRQPRMKPARAAARRDDLTARLRIRMEELSQRRQLAALAPLITGGALVVPEEVVARLLGRPALQHAKEVREVEHLAMEAVMLAEQQAGRLPRDVSAQNVGYDIESREPGRCAW